MAGSAALPGYTLAPEASLTQITNELRSAFDWLNAKGAEHGIAGPIIVTGWSAGGHLTAFLLDHPRVAAGLSISGVFELAPLRQLYPALGEARFLMAGTATQVLDWADTHRFCGRCATPTERVAHERCMRCPKCGLLAYPRISPAVIVLVRRGDEALFSVSFENVLTLGRIFASPWVAYRRSPNLMDRRPRMISAVVAGDHQSGAMVELPHEVTLRRPDAIFTGTATVTPHAPAGGPVGS